MAEEKCKRCGKGWDDGISLELTPCCERYICWDFCLLTDFPFNKPIKCPYCKKKIIMVHHDDSGTGETELRIAQKRIVYY